MSWHAPPGTSISPSFAHPFSPNLAAFSSLYTSWGPRPTLKVTLGGAVMSDPSLQASRGPLSSTSNAILQSSGDMYSASGTSSSSPSPSKPTGMARSSLSTPPALKGRRRPTWPRVKSDNLLERFPCNGRAASADDAPPPEAPPPDVPSAPSSGGIRTATGTSTRASSASEEVSIRSLARFGWGMDDKGTSVVWLGTEGTVIRDEFRVRFHRGCRGGPSPCWSLEGGRTPKPSKAVRILASASWRDGARAFISACFSLRLASSATNRPWRTLRSAAGGMIG
mmetsp:Transcript_23886/g.68609  ORF Transcript_23886/g.68609 Transcript_23886/m.68609 type:complete len:281 (+) Transcript_23886:3694-4536(+)